MILYDAINVVLETLITDQLINACYLKGDFASKNEDIHSRIEMFCLTNEENISKIIENKEKIFEQYHTILFIQFKKEQIQCVFENGVVFFLQLKHPSLVDTDEKLVIYDPNHLVYNDNINNHENIVELIHHFSFLALDYYGSFKREDFLYCLYLVQEMVHQYILLYQFLLNSTNNSLKIKGIWNILKEEIKQSSLDIFKWITIDKHLFAAKLVFEKMHQLIGYVPLVVANYLNLDFFLHAKNKISSISEEKI